MIVSGDNETFTKSDLYGHFIVQLPLAYLNFLNTTDNLVVKPCISYN